MGDSWKVPWFAVQWGRSRSSSLSWIREAILGKLEGWKEKLLNVAGKETLIKAVIQAIPSYAMLVLCSPKKFCEDLCTKVLDSGGLGAGEIGGFIGKGGIC